MPESKEYMFEADGELDRLKLQHDSIKELMPSLIIPPIDVNRKGLRILDSGTADGYWLRDIRPLFPPTSDITLIGTDITTSQFPSRNYNPAIPPPGPGSPTPLLFTQSILDPWPADFHSTFDLVHQRLVMGACGSHPQLDVIQRLVQLIRPGGWIQLIEPEQLCGMEDGPAMNQFIGLVTEVFRGLGGGVRYADSLARYLAESGCVRVQERGLPYWLGRGPGIERGDRRAKVSAMAAAGAMGPLIGFLKNKGIKTSLSDEELDTLGARLEKELVEQGGYYPLRVIWAQRAE